jgi:hypothetical protein
MNPLKNEDGIGIGRKPEGQDDRTKPGKGPFWREHGKYAQTWSEVKRLADNRVTFRCFANTVPS